MTVSIVDGALRKENIWLMGKLKIALLSLLACALGACAKGEGFDSVDANEFEKIIRSGDVQLVDVRRAEEFAEGHIPGALLLDVTREDFRGKAAFALNREKIVAVYCRSGKRSVTAANILVKEGYKVVNLRGGWLEWSAKGKPSERQTPM